MHRIRGHGISGAMDVGKAGANQLAVARKTIKELCRIGKAEVKFKEQ